MNATLDAETVSEPTFLITELRYTLGQLHVQLGDLDAEMRREAQCNGRSIDEILTEMLEDEDRHQAEYRRILGVSETVEHEEEALIGQTRFERERAQTVAMLEQAADNWPQELVELVKQHVAADRLRTTDIANCRKQLYEQDLRPDLNEPLADDEHNQPHALS